MNPDSSLEGILAQLPLYAPADDTRPGRISSTALEPGGMGLLKAVVDFGSTPEGPDTGPDIEIATRRRGDGAAADARRELRAFCGERELMERRARDPASAGSFALGADACWSQYRIGIDGDEHTFTVLATSRVWVGAACVGAWAMVRIFTPAPGPGPARLRRIRGPAELQPLRGRG